MIEPLTPAMQTILELLTLNENGWEYSVGLVKASGGRLKLGSISEQLLRLERRGFVISEIRPNARLQRWAPRRYFQITPAGAAALKASRG